MHILFVHNDYRKFSGEEEAVAALSGLLVRKGHRISWLRKSSAEIGDSLPRRLRAFASGIYNPGSRAEIEALLSRERFDVVHVQNLYPFISPSVLPACRARNIPVVMRCPNYRLFCPTGLHLREGKVCESCLTGAREWNCIRYNCEGVMSKSTGYAARNAFARMSGMITDNVTRFIVLSEFQKRRFVAGGIPEEKIAVLPNAASDADFSGGPLPVDGTVSYIGRMSEEKGIREFIEAARRLPQIPFAVAGSVGDMQELADSAPANVHFAGFLAGDALDAFFESSRIIVSPSKCFEGFPNVVAKAMARGRPVIASRLGALAEIVEEGRTGLLCEAGDPVALAGAISRLWGAQDLCVRMGQAGRAKALREYSETQRYSRLLNIYSTARESL